MIAFLPFDSALQPNPYILSTSVMILKRFWCIYKTHSLNTISLYAWQKSQVVQHHYSTKEEPKYISTLCAPALSVIHIKCHSLFTEQKRDPEYLGQFLHFLWGLLGDPFVYKRWGWGAAEFFEGYLAFYHSSLNLTYKSQAVSVLWESCASHPCLLSPLSYLLKYKNSSIMSLLGIYPGMVGLKLEACIQYYYTVHQLLD